MVSYVIIRSSSTSLKLDVSHQDQELALEEKYVILNSIFFSFSFLISIKHVIRPEFNENGGEGCSSSHNISFDSAIIRLKFRNETSMYSSNETFREESKS